MTPVFLDTNVTRLYYFPDFKYLHLELKNNVEYSLQTVEEDFKTINDLKKDEKIYVLIDMTNISFDHIPKEVMKYLADSPYSIYQIKLALVATGLGQKIIGNFYLNVFKPETNTKIFNSIKDAFKWFDLPDQELKLKQIDLALHHNY
jgi:ADP-dependent phosphofructokinase/glucokinase